jgi:hypothetical protein
MRGGVSTFKGSNGSAEIEAGPKSMAAAVAAQRAAGDICNCAFLPLSSCLIATR